MEGMATTMVPSGMLAAQADLASRFWAKDAEFLTLIARIVLDEMREGIAGIAIRNPDLAMEQAASAAEHLAHAARTAEVFHVSRDMTQVVMAAALALSDEDVFDLGQHAPSPNGLVRFEGGLDTGFDAVPIDWMLWTPTQFDDDASMAGIVKPDNLPGGVIPTTGAMVSRWIDVGNIPRHVSRSVRTMTGRWIFDGVLFVGDGWRMADIGRGRVDMDRRVLHALWLLLDQEVVVVSKQRPHPSQKAALRAARLPRGAQINVVELRRRKYVEGGTEAHRVVEHDHQWWVNGFWRWQHHGPGNTLKKRIWIDGHTRGPSDRPLRISPRVFAVRR
jgi:hypothetical protein